MCDAFVEREPKACAVETITVETATRTLEFIFKKSVPVGNSCGNVFCGEIAA